MTTAAGGRDAATLSGVTNFGAGVSTGGLTGAGGFGATGAAGFTAAGGGGGGATGFGSGRCTGGCATASFCWVIARRTSPGREMCERSIFVLISSSPRAARADFVDAGPGSACARKCLRTSSASFSSSELECVFFSVTPTSVRTSRIALLLTSNSLARSLIRILLIRPFVPPPVSLRSHVNLTDCLLSTVTCRLRDGKER